MVIWVKVGVGMKKQKRYLCITAVLFSLLLSGCGTQLHEMTQEEEDFIVHAAAYFVAKHNVQQKDGVSAVVDPDSIVLESESTDAVENDTEENTELGAEASSPSGDGSQGEQVVDNTVSLVEAIGHQEDLLITYVGSYSTEHYVEGAAYSVDANNGKKFYVMEFLITNETTDNVEVDNASINLGFKVMDEGISAKSEITFLTTDFSTYQGTIAPGESVKTILLFEVSESAADQITAPKLQVTIDNEIKNVKL